MGFSSHIHNHLSLHTREANPGALLVCRTLGEECCYVIAVVGSPSSESWQISGKSLGQNSRHFLSKSQIETFPDPLASLPFLFFEVILKPIVYNWQKWEAQIVKHPAAKGSNVWSEINVYLLSIIATETLSQVQKAWSVALTFEEHRIRLTVLHKDFQCQGKKGPLVWLVQSQGFIRSKRKKAAKPQETDTKNLALKTYARQQEPVCLFLSLGAARSLTAASSVSLFDTDALSS